MMERLTDMENSLYEAAGELKEDSAINPEWVDELKLPQQPEETAYLIRKQEQRRVFVHYLILLTNKLKRGFIDVQYE